MSITTTINFIKSKITEIDPLIKTNIGVVSDSDIITPFINIVPISKSELNNNVLNRSYFSGYEIILQLLTQVRDNNDDQLESIEYLETLIENIVEKTSSKVVNNPTFTAVVIDSEDSYAGILTINIDDQ